MVFTTEDLARSYAASEAEGLGLVRDENGWSDGREFGQRADVQEVEVRA